MEAILLVLIVVGILFLGFETWGYYKYAKIFKQLINLVESYGSTADQFIDGFEEIKRSVNHNADIQRESIEKLNDHGRTIVTILAMLEVYDRAFHLSLNEKMLTELERGQVNSASVEQV